MIEIVLGFLGFVFLLLLLFCFVLFCFFFLSLLLGLITFDYLPDNGERNGNPLQYSCLENPRDREAWWAAVCGVAQSQTQLM